MCIIEEMSNKVHQFDGFSFSNSLEEPNYWREHAHHEVQIAIPYTDARAWIDMGSFANKQVKQQIELGQSCIVYPNRPHALEWQQTAKLTLLHFHPEFFAKAIGDSIKVNSLAIDKGFLLVNDTLISELGTILCHLYSSGSMHIEKLYVENIASLLAVHLLKNHLNYELAIFDNQKKLSSKKLRTVFEYIEANLEEKITLSELASIAGVGKFYFCRLFKASTHMTPYKYVLCQRVERAKKLLKESDLPISDIALESGFSNQSHLAKHFRNMLDLTPLGYRQNSSY